MARDLLGKLLIRVSPEGGAALRLVEVEAYLGVEDPAAHTYGGRRTRRNETMWGEAGHLYVYFVYGMHHCCNVVTRGPDTPEAVLLRGGAATYGHELLSGRRGGRTGADLANGPGKLCAALAIGRELDGSDLTEQGEAWIADDGFRPRPDHVVSGPRIGVAYAGEAADWPLRFSVGEPPRAGARRGRGPRAGRSRR